MRASLTMAFDDVIGDRLERHADHDDAAARAERSKISAAAFSLPEHSKTTSAPQPSVSLHHDVGELAGAHIDADDGARHRGEPLGDGELAVVDVADDDAGAAGGEGGEQR